MRHAVTGWILTIAFVGLAKCLIPEGLAQPPPSPSATPSPPSPSARPSAPESKASDRMEQILKLFETSDYSTIGPLVQTSFAPEVFSAQGADDFMSYLADVVRRTGGIRRGKIRPNGNDAIG